jgi:hypothetical protein
MASVSLHAQLDDGRVCPRSARSSRSLPPRILRSVEFIVLPLVDEVIQ